MMTFLLTFFVAAWVADVDIIFLSCGLFFFVLLSLCAARVLCNVRAVPLVLMGIACLLPECDVSAESNEHVGFRRGLKVESVAVS